MDRGLPKELPTDVSGSIAQSFFATLGSASTGRSPSVRFRLVTKANYGSNSVWAVGLPMPGSSLGEASQLVWQELVKRLAIRSQAGFTSTAGESGTKD